MARLLDSHRTEVHCDDVERGVGGSLEHATEAAGKTVGAESLHCVDHHAAGTASAKRFHECGGECGHNIVADTEQPEHPGNPVHEQVHRAALTEYGDTYEDGDEVRDNHHGGVETVLCAFDKRFVGLHLLVHREPEECDDDAEQHDAADEEARGANRFGGEVAEVEHDGDDAGRKSAEPCDRHRVFELDLLEKAECENACHGAEERRKQEREENVARVCRPKLCAVGHDADRDERESARVQHEEHDLRVARDRLVFVRVQFLQLFHRLQAHRRGRVVEAEHVCADVHEHRAHDRVVLRNFGEQAAEQWGDDFRENLDGSRLLANLHDAEPEGKNAREAEGDFKRRLRHVERAEDSLVEDSGIAEGEPLHHARDKRAKEED